MVYLIESHPQNHLRRLLRLKTAATKLMNGTYNYMRKKNVAKVDNAVLE